MLKNWKKLFTNFLFPDKFKIVFLRISQDLTEYSSLAPEIFIELAVTSQKST